MKWRAFGRSDERGSSPHRNLTTRYCLVVLVDSAVYVDGVRSAFHDPDGTTGFSWVGIHDPTMLEMESYQHHFHFNDLALEDAVTAHQRPKLDHFDGHSFLVLKTVMFNGRGSPLTIGDVCVFFSDDSVVTVRHGDAMPLTTIRQDLESRPANLRRGPTAIVHEIVDRLVDQYVDVVHMIAGDVTAIEDSVFDDAVPAVPHDMYQVKRELIGFRRAVLPLLDPLTILASGAAQYVDPSFKFEFSDVRDHLLKVIDELDALEKTMDAAMQANLALISVKQNEDMRKISAWVGIAAVPTMLAGVYGMNFDNMPELGTRFGYFVVVGVMATACLTLYRLFRRNDWL
jgi:magnesium transporter